MATEAESPLLAAVGQRIRALRADRDLNLEQLARLTGSSCHAAHF